MQKRRTTASAGYSLTELLTVVAMVGVITLVTLPAFMQLMPQYRIRSAATDASSAIRMIRQKAMTTRTPWKISFDATGERYRYYMLTNPHATRSVDANWIAMDQEAVRRDNQNDAWVRTTAVDLRTNTSNPFKDIDCPIDSQVDLVFLRDGKVANNPACGGATNLAFTTPPSIVFAITNNYVRYNRYYISVSEAGAVTVTATKE